MSAVVALGQRSLREVLRQPDALFMTMFIPLFFLVVNTGQAAEIFPSDSTGFLEGQGYGAFQLPITLLLAASFGMAPPVPRGGDRGRLLRQAAGDPYPPLQHRARPSRRRRREGPRPLASVIVLVALPFGITIASGVAGFVLLVLMGALWGVVYAGFMQLIALKTRSAAADERGRADLLPVAVPHAELRPARPTDRTHGDRGHDQPGDLPDGGDALAHPRRPGLGRDLARVRGHRRLWER